MGISKKLFSFLAGCSIVATAFTAPVSVAESMGHPSTLTTGKPRNTDIAKYNLVFGITSRQEVEDCQARVLVGPQPDIFDPEIMCPSAPISRVDWSLSALIWAIPNLLTAIFAYPFSGAVFEVIGSIVRAITYLVVSPSANEQVKYTN